jgi:hypothetical protein
MRLFSGSSNFLRGPDFVVIRAKVPMRGQGSFVLSGSAPCVPSSNCRRQLVNRTPASPASNISRESSGRFIANMPPSANAPRAFLSCDYSIHGLLPSLFFSTATESGVTTGTATPTNSVTDVGLVPLRTHTLPEASTATVLGKPDMVEATNPWAW